MAYAEKLKDPRWQKRRLEILNRDNFTCLMCGDMETELHIHHDSYLENPWDTGDDELATYCKHCHSLEEYVKRKLILNHVFKVRISKTQLYLYGISYENEYVSIYVYQYDNGKIKQVCEVPASILKKVTDLFNPINL